MIYATMETFEYSVRYYPTTWNETLDTNVKDGYVEFSYS